MSVHSAGIVLVDESMNTVIVQNHGKYWGFPKGRLTEEEVLFPQSEEFYLDSCTAAQREFREETGYNVPFVPHHAPMEERKKHYELHCEDKPYIQFVKTAGKDCIYDPQPRRMIRISYRRSCLHDKSVRKYITMYLCVAKDIHKLDFSGDRDKDITDVRIVPLEDTRPSKHTASAYPQVYDVMDYKAATMLATMSMVDRLSDLEDEEVADTLGLQCRVAKEVRHNLQALADDWPGAGQIKELTNGDKYYEKNLVAGAK